MPAPAHSWCLLENHRFLNFPGAWQAGISPLLLFHVVFPGKKSLLQSEKGWDRWEWDAEGRFSNVLGLGDLATTKILVYSSWDLGIL